MRNNTYFAKFSLCTGIVLSLFLAAGCGSLLPGEQSPGTQTGSLHLAASLSEVAAGDFTGATLELTLTKDSSVVTKEVPVGGDVVTATVESLLPGTWEATLALKDIEGIVQYLASSPVNIVPGTTVAIELLLLPSAGTLEVTAPLGLYPELNSATKARLYINPGGYSAMDLTDANSFIGTKELAPGTYDYSISFYSNGYLVGDLIYESPWTTVTIKPGKKTAALWDPGTGTGAISGHLDAPPPVPANLALSAGADGITATWQAVPAADLAGYRVYLRSNCFAKFDLVSEQTALQTTYLYAASKLDTGDQVEVAVTAYDAAGNESERSPVVTRTW